MKNALSTIMKIAVASLLAGIVLARLDLSAEQILTELGFEAENLMQYLQAWVQWAVPKIVLGFIVILPVSLVVFLFRSPRG